MPLTPEQLAAMRGSMGNVTRDSLFQPEQEESDHWQATKGLISGGHQTLGLISGAAALVGDAVGSDWLKEKGMAGYQSRMEKAAEYAPNVTFTEIDGIGDFGDWAAYTLGNLAPTMATMFATGGVGAAVAKRGIKEYGEKVLQDQLKKGIGKKAAEKAALEAVEKRVAYGLGAGSFTGSTTLEGGGIYGETEDVGVTLAHAPIAGALDAWSGMGILRKFVPSKNIKQFKEAIIESVSLDIGLTMLKEGGTEALQGFVGQHANYWAATDGKSLLGDLGSTDWIALIEEGAAGMLGGLAFGGTGTAYSRVKHPELYKVEKIKEEEKADQNAREQTKQQGGDALSQTLAASEARMGTRAQQDIPDNPLDGAVELSPEEQARQLNTQSLMLRAQMEDAVNQLSSTTDPNERTRLGKQVADLSRQLSRIRNQVRTQENTTATNDVQDTVYPDNISIQRQGSADQLQARQDSDIESLNSWFERFDRRQERFNNRQQAQQEPTAPEQSQQPQVNDDTPVWRQWNQNFQQQETAAEINALERHLNEEQAHSQHEAQQQKQRTVDAAKAERVVLARAVVQEAVKQKRIGFLGQRMAEEMAEQGEIPPNLQDLLPLVAGQAGLDTQTNTDILFEQHEQEQAQQQQEQQAQNSPLNEQETAPEHMQNISFAYGNNIENIQNQPDYPVQPRTTVTDSRLQNPHYREYLSSLADQAYQQQLNEKQNNLPENETVLQAIKRLKGINTESIEDTLAESVKFAASNKQLSGFGGLYINKNGMTLDDMATALHEDGFHIDGREMTVNELSEAIWNELSGRPMFADFTGNTQADTLNTSTNAVTVPAIRAALSGEPMSPVYQQELLRLLEEAESDPYFEAPEYLTREALEIEQQRLASATPQDWFDHYELAVIDTAEAVTGIDPEQLNAADWEMVAEAEQQQLLDEAAQHEQQLGEQDYERETDDYQGTGPTVRYGTPGMVTQDRQAVPEEPASAGHQQQEQQEQQVENTSGTQSSAYPDRESAIATLQLKTFTETTNEHYSFDSFEANELPLINKNVRGI